MEGWIKLHRKFLTWEWYDNLEMVKLYIHLLLKANHAVGTWHGVEIKRGQLITGLEKLSEQTKISIQKLRTCLSRLEKTGEINMQTTNKYRLITICNYESYQGDQQATNNQTNKQLTNNQQATNKQLTANNNNKNKENENNEEELILIETPKSIKTEKAKKIRKSKSEGLHSFADSPYFDLNEFKKKIDIQYHKYDLRFYHQSGVDYSASSGKKYLDWVAAIRSWINNDAKEGKAKMNTSGNGQMKGIVPLR